MVMAVLMVLRIPNAIINGNKPPHLEDKGLVEADGLQSTQKAVSRR
jgi:hypothetical protein